MTAGHQLPGVERLVAAFHTFRHSVFRLETRQVYAEPVEEPNIAAFNRGDPGPPPDPVEDEWAGMLRAHRDAGRLQQRVHVVTEPITGYLAYELCWEYGPHTAAGEDIRIIPVTTSWPVDVPRHDFTLFDSKWLFELDYAHGGVLLGAREVADWERVAAACRVRDAALRQAVSWTDYIARYPDLVRRVPKGL